MKNCQITYPVLNQNGNQKSYFKLFIKAFFIATYLSIFINVNVICAQVSLPPTDSYINIDGGLSTAFVEIIDSTNT